jgi:predicted metal-dependent TIM-barrel fold hydrolase
MMMAFGITATAGTDDAVQHSRAVGLHPKQCPAEDPEQCPELAAALNNRVIIGFPAAPRAQQGRQDIH